MNGTQYPNVNNGWPQQMPGNGGQQPNGQPVQNPGFYSQIQAGAPQPQAGFGQPSAGYPQVPQNPVPQQRNIQSQNQGGYASAMQNTGYTGSGAQQESVQYTQILCSAPASGKLEDLQMTVFLSINMAKLFFEKFISKNGNPCVGINMDLVLGDQFVSQMFGPHMVRPDHVVSVSTVLGGYNAKRFLEKTPNSTKVIAILLKDFRMETFNRRDGSSGVNVQASCDGYQVIHYSSKYKASDVKQCNLEESKPYHIKDKTNGVVGTQQYQQQPGPVNVPQAGNGQMRQGNYAVNPTMIPGVTAFSEMDEDDDLPF